MSPRKDTRVPSAAGHVPHGHPPATLIKPVNAILFHPLGITFRVPTSTIAVIIVCRRSRAAAFTLASAGGTPTSSPTSSWNLTRRTCEGFTASRSSKKPSNLQGDAKCSLPQLSVLAAAGSVSDAALSLPFLTVGDIVRAHLVFLQRKSRRAKGSSQRELIVANSVCFVNGVLCIPRTLHTSWLCCRNTDLQ